MDKDKLREEYFKMHGIAAPIAKKHNERDPAIFEWICSKIEEAEKEGMLRREEVIEQLKAADELLSYIPIGANPLRNNVYLPGFNEALKKYQTIRNPELLNN